MISALTRYLAAGGDAWIASPAYEERRLALADKMKREPISVAAMAETLGLPVPVVCELYNTWQAERAASHAVLH